MHDPSANQDPEEQFKELLQELRVGLPGVQVLLAFLLVAPFNAGFTKLDDGQRSLFIGAVVCAALASVLLIAPSAHHRFAWPIGPRGLELLLRLATWEARAGLIFLGVSIVASILVVAALVVGSTLGIAAATLIAVAIAALWVVVPLLSRRLDPATEPAQPSRGGETGHD